MAGLIAADIHAKTDAMMWMEGFLMTSSSTFTSIKGRKLSRNRRKIVSIILVNFISSLLWDLLVLRADLLLVTVDDLLTGLGEQ